jgi:aminoglycoside phosphotransferase (APT) family kinase protein
MNKLLTYRRRIQSFRWFSSVTAQEPKRGGDFNHQNLFSYLCSNADINKGMDAVENWSLSQFTHGQSNPTFVLNYRGKKTLVVRKQPHGQLLKGAHAVDREFRVMTALLSTHVPVPRTRLYCDDVSIIGTPFFVYDYVPGEFYKSSTLPEFSNPLQRQRVHESMLRTLASIHAVKSVCS